MSEAQHSKDFCGACGNCYLHCPCSDGPTASFQEACRRWDAWEAPTDIDQGGQVCIDIDSRYRLEQWGTMQAIKDAVRWIGKTGQAQCRYCDYVATGETLGDVLEDLGGHGEYVHRGILENQRQEAEE